MRSSNARKATRPARTAWVTTSLVAAVLVFASRSYGQQAQAAFECRERVISRDPSWAPDGNAIVFSSNRSGNFEIWLHDLETGAERLLTTSDTQDFYPTVSPDGSRVAYSAYQDSGVSLGLVSTAGEDNELLTDPAEGSADPHWSPDGDRLVYMSDREGSRDIWIMDLTDLAQHRVRELRGEETVPRFSPDGTTIVFASKIEGDWDIYTIGVDGGGLTNLTNSPTIDLVPSWSPDGRVVAYYALALSISDAPTPETRTAARATGELMVAPLEGGWPRRITRNHYLDQSPTWSPDGGTLAFTSCASGGREVWLADADGRNPRRLTFTTGSSSR